MSSGQRYKRFVAKILADGGRMMHVPLNGELCALVAHIRRRDGLKTDSDAVRVAIQFCAMARRRNKASASEA